MTDPSRKLRSGTDYEAESAVPRWVKLASILLAVVVLLVVVVVLIGRGGHGPSRHEPSGGGDDPTPSSASGVSEGHVPPVGGHG